MERQATKKSFNTLVCEYLCVCRVSQLKKLSEQRRRYEAKRRKIVHDFASRFRITKRSFQAIGASLSFCTDLGNDDPWSSIRPFFDAVNERRIKVVIPGEDLVIDESMSKWCTKETQSFAVETIPHSTKIIRKPVPVRYEFKVLCHRQSGVVMRLE